MSGTKYAVVTPSTRVISREIESSLLHHSFVQSLVVFLQIELERFHHADDFLFANFLTAAERVFKWAVVVQRVLDELGAADEKPGALRSANRFAAAERDEVVAHPRVVPEMRNGRRVRSGVNEARNIVLACASLGHSSTLISPAAFAKLVKCIIAVRGLSRALARSSRVSISTSLHAGGAELVIEWVAMRFLNDDLGLHPREIGQLTDELLRCRP